MLNPIGPGSTEGSQSLLGTMNMEVTYNKPIKADISKIRVIVEVVSEIRQPLTPKKYVDFTVVIEDGTIEGDIPELTVSEQLRLDRASCVFIGPNNEVVSSGRNCGMPGYVSDLTHVYEGKIVDWDFCPNSVRDMAMLLSAIEFGDYDKLPKSVTSGGPIRSEPAFL
jgi:hypothetical protein